MVWLSTWSLTQKETPLSAPCIHVLRKRRFPHHAITCSENMLFFLKLTGLHRRDELPTSFDQQASGSAVIRSYHLGASSEALNCRSCNWTRRECVTHSPKSRQTSFCLRSMRCAERSARLRRRLSRLNSRQEHRRIAYRGIGAAYGANYAGCHRRCGGVEGCRALHIGAPQRFLQCGAYVRADLAGRGEFSGYLPHCLGANALRSLNKSELSVLRSLKHPPESAKCACSSLPRPSSAQLSFRQ